MAKKGFVLMMAALFLAGVMITGTALQGMAGGGPAPPTYAKWKEVGPEIRGEVTLVPADQNSIFKATLKGTCGGQKVTLKTEFPVGKDISKPELTAADITRDAKNCFLKAGSYTLKDPSNCCKPASGTGDLLILEMTGVKIKGKGKNMKITGKTRVTYIEEDKTAKP
jgi:hypothetical protein